MSAEVWTRLIDEVESFRSQVRELPVARGADPEALRRELDARFPLDDATPLHDLVTDISRLLRTWTVHVTHPRYFGLFNPSVRTAGVVGDVLAAAYNPQLAVWSHAPAAQELERLALRTFTRALGMDPDAVLANFTTGGAEANLSAVLAALADAFPDAGSAGLAGLSARPAIYLTRESHHSLIKIARMSGLGTAALRMVPTTSRFTMDPAALEDRIRADAADGWHPLLILATAGTTATGAIDPLPALGQIANRHDIWLHVDAAWGGAAVLSPDLRPALAGIELADSVTWDAHKWLSVPMGAGMFFCARPEAVRRAFAITASYMPEETGGVDDPYATTAQWSRRAIGLKVFLSLAELGLSGYRSLIERQARMGDALRERLRDRDWVVVNDTPLPLVCFTHPDIRGGRATTDRILAAILERGRVWISQVEPNGGPAVLRACVTSFRTEESDVDCLIEELERARRLAARAG
ncbi:MAG: pyridoxal phosphate-dependent decarboxylase family protein [Gemmatimonadota bacterium]